MKRIILTLLILFSLLSAQTSNRDYIKYVLPEACKVTPGYLILGAGAGLTALAFLADDPVSSYMSSNQVLPEGISRFADSYVDSYWAFGVSALAAVGRGALDGDYLKPLRYWTISTVATVGVTYAFKYGVGRLRPNMENNRSFVSGHASIAFSTATMLQMWYGWKAGVPAYAMAALTAFQRLDDNKHWLSDVVAGTVVGIVIPYMLFKGEEKFEDQSCGLPMYMSISIPFQL